MAPPTEGRADLSIALSGVMDAERGSLSYCQHFKFISSYRNRNMLSFGNSGSLSRTQTFEPSAEELLAENSAHLSMLCMDMYAHRDSRLIFLSCFWICADSCMEGV